MAKFASLCGVLFFLTISVTADPVSYDLTQWCGNDIYVETSAIFTAGGYLYQGTCNVTIRADHASYENQVRFEVMSLHTRCYRHWIRLYDGDSGRSLSEMLCGEQDYSELFLSDRSSLKISIFSSEPYYDDDLTTRMLATSTSTWYESGDFVCDNGYDVDSSLQCDGYNNCGDFSDEKSSLCDNDDVISWTSEIGIILGVSIVCLVVVVLLIAAIVKNRRQAASNYVTGRQPMLKPDYNFGPPPYGAINHGYGAPPPYSPSVTMPPPPPPAGFNPTPTPAPTTQPPAAAAVVTEASATTAVAGATATTVTDNDNGNNNA